MDDYLHKSFLAQLKESATTLFNLFSDAYKNLNEDVLKAENQFKDVLTQANYIVKALPFYDNEFISINREEDYFYIIQILSLCIKASHNLIVIARHNKDKNSQKIYKKINSIYKGKFYFYYHLVYLFNTNKKVKEVVDVFFKEVYYELVEKAIGETMVLEFSLRHNMLKNYLSYEFKDEYKHYFKAYQTMKLFDDIELDNIRKTLGMLLVKNINDERILKIIYESIFFESLLLEYAYQSNNSEVVEKVLHNGYDHYLEIDTLYIVYTYDKKRYQKYFKELKYISLSRLIELCDPKGDNHLLVEDIYPREFLDETNANCKEFIAKIDRNDKSDYRNKDERDTPLRFKK